MEHRNEVMLLGAISGEPDWRDLPDGGQVVIWRTVVRRRSERSERVTHDTLRCVAYDRGVQRSAHTWARGDLLEIRGSLRRRFWGPGRSVHEVEVFSATRHRLPSGNDPPA